MEAELLPRLTADDLLPGRFVKKIRLHRNRIEDDDLMNVAFLQNLYALCADRVAG